MRLYNESYFRTKSGQMNLDLEELYKLRHALNVAAVHGEIDVNDPVIQKVADEIRDQEFELEQLPHERTI